MADYHVGCGGFGIYAGVLNKKGDTWRNKNDVTNECLPAAAQYLLEQGVYFKFQHKGKTYMMTVKESEDTDEQRP